MNQIELLQKLSELLEEKKSDILLDYKTPQELSEILQLDNQEKTQDFDTVFSYIKKYITYSVNSDHPQFLNRMWTGANPASILGEIVTAVQQTSACTYESAPVSTLMEKYLLSQVAEIIGFTKFEGQMTTGSSNANMIAMMLARNTQNNTIKKSGLYNQTKQYAFVNEESHYSLDKAVNILGIGSENLIKIKAQQDGSLNIEDLENKIIAAQKEGKVFFVCATAGTTVRGGYDNLEEISKLKKKYNFWLHVDGAWGGAVIFDTKLKQKYLEGLENVDSFTMDFHKMLGTALMCNVFLVNNNRSLLSQTLGAGNTDYIFKDTQEESIDFGISSLQCGRRVDSLKLFLDWKYYGIEGFGKKVTNYYSLCDYAQKYIENNDKLTLTHKRNSFNLCFIYKFAQKNNEKNKQIRELLYKRGLGLVGSSTLDNIYFLRLLICNDFIKTSHIDSFFENIISLGDEINNENICIG